MNTQILELLDAARGIAARSIVAGDPDQERMDDGMWGGPGDMGGGGGSSSPGSGHAAARAAESAKTIPEYQSAQKYHRSKSSEERSLNANAAADMHNRAANAHGNAANKISGFASGAEARKLSKKANKLSDAAAAKRYGASIEESVLTEGGETLDRRLIRIVGMALPLGVGKEAPTRLMVFPLGEPPSNDDRKWRFTKAGLTQVVADFQTRTEPLPILYEHGKGPRGGLAAGWIDSVDLAADGLYANVHWTDTARTEIRAGEWGFRSPAWDGEESDDGFLLGGPLAHLALVNDPAIGGMAPVSASSQPSTITTPPEKENQMANVEAAKTKAANMDKAGLLGTFRDAYAIPPAISDDMCCQLCCEAMGGSYTPSADGTDPMPGAAEKPAVPLAPFASAEDVAKVEAATAAATDGMKKENEALKTRVKELEAAQLSGRLITANAADRKSGPPKTFAERIREQRVAGVRG